jgi:hypothetical protein
VLRRTSPHFTKPQDQRAFLSTHKLVRERRFYKSLSPTIVLSFPRSRRSTTLVIFSFSTQGSLLSPLASFETLARTTRSRALQLMRQMSQDKSFDPSGRLHGCRYQCAWPAYMEGTPHPWPRPPSAEPFVTLVIKEPGGRGPRGPHGVLPAGLIGQTSILAGRAATIVPLFFCDRTRPEGYASSVISPNGYQANDECKIEFERICERYGVRVRSLSLR